VPNFEASSLLMMRQEKVKMRQERGAGKSGVAAVG
jgi:hypothetical protein